MIDFPAAVSALDILFGTPDAWLVVIPGLLIGLVMGAIPGVSSSMAMAVFLPLTIYMDFLPAILFLTAIFTGGGFGGSVPAILMNVPGAASAVATTFDGYPMAQQGRHNEALGLALGASVGGTLISYLILFLLIDPLSEAVLRLGPLEMLMIIAWGILLIGALSGDSIPRGLMAGAFGVLIGTVGMNTAGYVRGTAGLPELLDGVSAIPAMMGMFVASQLFNLMSQEYLVTDENQRKIEGRAIRAGVMTAIKRPTILLRGALIGVFVGAIPGVGSAVANLLSYAETRRSSDDPDSFGKGNPDGVIASEAANSSSEGGSMTTMLALGIPGGGATAVLLSAFAMHNVLGGPQFIDEHKDVVYAIVFGNFLQAGLLAVVGLGFVFVASSVVRVPIRYLIPSVLVFATYGAYALQGQLVGPITLWVFALFGWIMARYGFSIPAIVVGLFLGSHLETQLLRSFQLSGGDVTYITERPVAMAILATMIVSMSLTAFFQRRKAARRLTTPVE